MTCPSTKLNPAHLSTNQVMEFVSNHIKENGVKVRKNSVYAVEIVISLNTWDIDYRSFFQEVYTWALDYYKVPILSCWVHFDEGKPHIHLLLLPIRDGRLVGSKLVGYKYEMAKFKSSLYNQVGKKFKLRPDPKEVGTENAEVIIKKLQGDSIRNSSYWNLFAEVIRQKPNLFLGIINL